LHDAPSIGHPRPTLGAPLASRRAAIDLEVARGVTSVVPTRPQILRKSRKVERFEERRVRAGHGRQTRGDRLEVHFEGKRLSISLVGRPDEQHPVRTGEVRFRRLRPDRHRADVPVRLEGAVLREKRRRSPLLRQALQCFLLRRILYDGKVLVSNGYPCGERIDRGPNIGNDAPVRIHRVQRRRYAVTGRGEVVRRLVQQPMDHDLPRVAAHHDRRGVRHNRYGAAVDASLEGR